MKVLAPLVVVLLMGCSEGSFDGPYRQVWVQDDSELVLQGNAVIDAVASLPECAAVLGRGGHVRWRAHIPYCQGPAWIAGRPMYFQPTSLQWVPWKPTALIGCAHLDADPPLIEVVFESAWGTANPQRSTLASALCLVCGYTSVWEAEACARRARINFVETGGDLTNPARVSAWDQDASEFLLQGNAVTEAVAALPECSMVRQGGLIRWRGVVPNCPPDHLEPVLGCGYPGARPPLVQMVFESAWCGCEPEPPWEPRSTLAHELCHVCGYLDQQRANACAERARAVFSQGHGASLVERSGLTDGRSLSNR